MHAFILTIHISVLYMYTYIKFFSNYMQSTKSVKYRNSLKILARAETVA